MISTVLGEISEEKLGVVLPHEHIFIDMRGCVTPPERDNGVFYERITAENRAEVFFDPYAILDNALLDGRDTAVQELLDFKKWGGNTIVDCTLDEIGRDVAALRDVSLRTGVNVIVGCGHYYHRAHFPYVKEATLEALADEMTRDILVGIGDTGIKAGVIGEIGTSATVTDDEKKVLAAAGAVSAQTGRPIHVHTDLYTENGIEIVKMLTKAGARAEKICIDHIDVLLRPNYVRSLLQMGVYVEFDNFGKEFFVSRERRFCYDLERIRLLGELIDEGYGSKLLLSNDICLKSMWRKYGGNGYSHILRTVRYMAQENGISEKAYSALLCENPKNFLK